MLGGNQEADSEMNGDSVAQPGASTPGPQHGGGNDPPQAGPHQQSDGESDLYDTTNLAPEEARTPPGTVFWQFVLEQDWWNCDVWVDFDPCWSANVDKLYASMASYMAPGAICHEDVAVHVPDQRHGEKIKTSTVYKYNFFFMTQTNEKTGKVRKIRRLTLLA